MTDIYDDNNSLLENLASELFLIELVNKNRAEVFENVVFEGKKRYYIEDLSKRDYSLENTTPYQLDINGAIIEEHAWGNLLCKAVKCLIECYPKQKEALLSFRCNWTKSPMFTEEEKTNHKLLDDNLYLNCNHTALHSCWLLQDLLDFFDVNKSSVVLLIHRPPSAEPKATKEYIEKRFKKGFVDWLNLICKKNDEEIEWRTQKITTVLNPILGTVSKGYNNFYLFDEYAYAYNYAKKVKDKIKNSIWNNETKLKLNESLDLLLKYYKE